MIIAYYTIHFFINISVLNDNNTESKNRIQKKNLNNTCETESFLSVVELTGLSKMIFLINPIIVTDSEKSFGN